MSRQRLGLACALFAAAACGSAPKSKALPDVPTRAVSEHRDRAREPASDGGAGGEGGADGDSPPTAPRPTASALEPPACATPITPPPARDCRAVLNPPTATWPALEGCTVAFESGLVTQERECTQMACGPELPCCNRCFRGKLAFRKERDWLLLSRAGTPLECKEGRNCQAQRDCEAPPGDADVTGTLWRRDGFWHLDVTQLTHRVGHCARQTVETAGGDDAKLRCDASYRCDDGLEVGVSCEADSDRRHANECTCKMGTRVVAPSRSVSGEPPSTCDQALLLCLPRQKRKPVR